MHPVLRRILFSVTAAVLSTGAVAGIKGHVSVTPKVSTLGLGADVSFKLKQRLNLRLTGQQLGYETSQSVDGVDYDANLDLRSIGTVVDLFPRDGRFRLTAGLFANGNELTTVARLDPASSYDIGNGSFTGAGLGTINGAVTFAPLAPFAGVGWGNPFKTDRRFGFSADLGIAHQPLDQTDLRSSDPFADPLIDQELDNEERRFEQEVEFLEFYPVVSLGLSILF